jgi:hypothetical protein
LSGRSGTEVVEGVVEGIVEGVIERLILFCDSEGEFNGIYIYNFWMVEGINGYGWIYDGKGERLIFLRNEGNLWVYLSS